MHHYHWVKLESHFTPSEPFHQANKRVENKKLLVARKLPKSDSVFRNQAEWILNESMRDELIPNRVHLHYAMVVVTGEFFRYFAGDRQPKYRVILTKQGPLLASKRVNDFTPLEEYYESKEHKEQPAIEGLGRVSFLKYLIKDNDVHLQNLGINKEKYAIAIDHDRAFWPLGERNFQLTGVSIFYFLHNSIESICEDLKESNKKIDDVLKKVIQDLQKLADCSPITLEDEFKKPERLSDNPYINKTDLLNFIEIIKKKYDYSTYEACHRYVLKSSRMPCTSLLTFTVKNVYFPLYLTPLPRRAIGKRNREDYIEFPEVNRSFAAYNWNFNFHISTSQLKQSKLFVDEKHLTALKMMTSTNVLKYIIHKVYREFESTYYLVRKLALNADPARNDFDLVSSLEKTFLLNCLWMDSYIDKTVKDLHSICLDDPSFKEFLTNHAEHIGFILVYEMQLFFKHNKHYHFSYNSQMIAVYVDDIIKELKRIFQRINLRLDYAEDLKQFAVNLECKHSDPLLKYVIRFYQETKQNVLAEQCQQIMSYYETSSIYPLAMIMMFRKKAPKQPQQVAHCCFFSKKPPKGMPMEYLFDTVQQSKTYIKKFLGV